MSTRSTSRDVDPASAVSIALYNSFYVVWIRFGGQYYLACEVHITLCGSCFHELLSALKAADREAAKTTEAATITEAAKKTPTAPPPKTPAALAAQW